MSSGPASQDDKVVRLEVVGRTLDRPVEAPAGEPPGDGDGGGRKKRKRRADGLPDGCPVEPLGMTGNLYAYLDEQKQLRELRAKDHTRSDLISLVGTRIDWLYETWPRTDKDGRVVGWRPEKFGEALMKACAHKGIWSAAERVRAAGAWRGADGELVLHCGDLVAVVDKEAGRYRELKPGMIDGNIYPAGEAMPRPEIDTTGSARAAVEEILADLSTWAWARGERDARLLLGWLASAQVGGALKWRSVSWLTGGAGTGKSSLQDYIKGVFDGAIIRAESASPAAIWQTLGRSSLPCAVDELEPDEDNPRKARGLIELARIAASSGVLRRGGNDHQPILFTLRSSFLFSSVLVPAMSSADRTRMAILELGALPGGQKPPDLRVARLRRLGAALRARLITGWPRLDDLVETMRDGLIRRGHSSRGADQFGTLLACADLVLHDEPPDGDSLDELLDAYALDSLAEVAADAPSHERCLTYLLSSLVDPYRSGERRTVGEWVERALPIAEPLGPGYDAAHEAQTALKRIGLRVEVEAGEVKYLAIANNHQGLANIYERSHWAARSGSDGVWRQDLKRIDGAVPSPRPIRFAGSNSRAILVPIERVRGSDMD